MINGALEDESCCQRFRSYLADSNNPGGKRRLHLHSEADDRFCSLRLEQKLEVPALGNTT